MRDVLPVEGMNEGLADEFDSNRSAHASNALQKSVFCAQLSGSPFAIKQHLPGLHIALHAMLCVSVNFLYVVRHTCSRESDALVNGASARQGVSS